VDEGDGTGEKIDNVRGVQSGEYADGGQLNFFELQLSFS
jgi:hypothetical protein